jgi:hypothetical protein
VLSSGRGVVLSPIPPSAQGPESQIDPEVRCELKSHALHLKKGARATYQSFGIYIVADSSRIH